MDLGAYAQIDNLEQIMRDNGISVPRLRGLRLMKDEKALSKEEMAEVAKEDYLYRCANLCTCEFNPHAYWSEYSARTDAIREYYMEFEVDEHGVNYLAPIAIRWDRIHGKKRKAFKYVIRRAKEETQKQYDVWNKYCGRDDVLYIHARMGGSNWNYYDGDKLEKQPWFLEKVDDHFDSTYCDIYARIK